MTNEVLIAIISGISSLCGSIFGVIGSAKLLTYRITQLEKKMEKQCENCAIMDGRVDKLEARQDVIEEKIKVANNRIKNLEEKG